MTAEKATPLDGEKVTTEECSSGNQDSNSDRWLYPGTGLAHCYGKHLGGDFGQDEATAEVQPVHDGNVAFSVLYGDFDDRDGVEVEVYTELEPEMAQAFAIDLLRCASDLLEGDSFESESTGEKRTGST